MQVHPYILIDFIFNEPWKNYSQTIKETKKLPTNNQRNKAAEIFEAKKAKAIQKGKENWKPESRLTQTATTKELEK